MEKTEMTRQSRNKKWENKKKYGENKKIYLREQKSKKDREKGKIEEYDLEKIHEENEKI